MASDTEGHWITIDGEHVLVGNGGSIEKGPKNLIGNKIGPRNFHGETASGRGQHKGLGTKTTDARAVAAHVKVGDEAEINGKRYHVEKVTSRHKTETSFGDAEGPPQNIETSAIETRVHGVELDEKGGTTREHATHIFKTELSKRIAASSEISPMPTASDTPSETEVLALAVRLSRCAHCSSFDVKRMPGKDNAGPTDSCQRCGANWPHKPGSITAEQMVAPTVDPEPMVIASLSAMPFVLNLASTGEGMPLPMGLEHLPQVDDAGQQIHYRKMKVAQCGEWKHCGTGDDLPISRARADAWIQNTKTLSAAGRQPFIPTHHVFSNPDAKDNLGNVVRLERDGDDVYAVVGLHGDDALKVAARNGRSIGIIKDARDAKGNIVVGETLHHLALVPNPALPHLGGMVKIAASADSQSIEVPVYTLSTRIAAQAGSATIDTQTLPAPQPAGKSGRRLMMNSELATKARAAFSLSADDVPDDKLDDAVAEKALALSASVPDLTKERDNLKAQSDQLAKDKTDLEGRLKSADGQVLALSAGDPSRLDPINLSAFEMNADMVWEADIKAGAISSGDVVKIKGLLRDKGGKPTRMALSASGDNGYPLEINLARLLGGLATPIRTGNQLPSDATEAQRKELALSADANDQSKADPGEVAEFRKQSGLPAKA